MHYIVLLHALLQADTLTGDTGALHTCLKTLKKSKLPENYKQQNELVQRET